MSRLKKTAISVVEPPATASDYNEVVMKIVYTLTYIEKVVDIGGNYFECFEWYNFDESDKFNFIIKGDERVIKIWRSSTPHELNYAISEAMDALAEIENIRYEANRRRARFEELAKNLSDEDLEILKNGGY